MSDFFQKNLTFFHSEKWCQCHLTFICPSHFGLSPWPSLRSVPFWFLLPASTIQCQSRTSSLTLFAFYWDQTCLTVTSGQSSSLPDWGVQVVKREGDGAHCGGKWMSPSTLASLPLEMEVIWWYLMTLTTIGVRGYVWISSSSLLSFINADLAYLNVGLLCL